MHKERHKHKKQQRKLRSPLKRVLKIRNVQEYIELKSSLGAIQAARFLEIEEQILLIIDLQIESASPIVE